MQPSSSNPVVFHFSQVPRASQMTESVAVQPTAISQVSSTSATETPIALTVPHSQAQRTPLPQPVVPQAAQQGATLDQSCSTVAAGACVLGTTGTLGTLGAGLIACCVSPLVGIQICGYGFTTAGTLITASGLHEAVSTGSCLAGGGPQHESMVEELAHEVGQNPATTTGAGIAVGSIGVTALGVLGIVPGMPLPVLGAFAGASLACYGVCKSD